MTRILVTRSPEDAARTAERLKALGFDACQAPVTRIVPTGDPAPDAPYDALIVTSAHAADALAGLDRLKLVFAVGEHTAEVIRPQGYTRVIVADGDAVSLSRLIREQLPPGLVLLHVTARHHKEEPALSLRQAGFTVLQWEAYEAQAVETLPEAAVEALRTGQIGAALHYSRRSADLVVRLVREAGLASNLQAFPHLCLSADVAAPLMAVGAAVRVAEGPSEDALLRLLDSLP
ncbi:uroporphyrinogen-III synthase [Microvirga lotononidis]|uniref:Uroporphyrinogen-III synthase n=1 Tax=Microvirga lotononidis TaxID=864069 RepID=I4YMT2_9HYPH|nr:uroporphyrinogen-III synthase [Microvirga lotononidis]EIM25274.1 uroporphyrinogen-III synthase [Microvirga lotononidis]WQO29248.1 uroporphyrinogen-III synthase [Microvirga lotononidis]